MSDRTPPRGSGGRARSRNDEAARGKKAARSAAQPAKSSARSGKAQRPKANESEAKRSKTRRGTAQDPRSRVPGGRNGKAAKQQAKKSAPRKPAPRRPPSYVFRLADPRKRLRVLLVGICVLLSLFAGRLVQLQGLDASAYVVSGSQIGRTSVTLDAERGDIIDRNGNSLARAVEAYNVFVDQTQVENPAAYALQLEEILDQDSTTLQKKLTGDRPFKYLAKGVTGSNWRDVKELGLDGIGAEDAEVRAYPAGAVAGSVVGFLGADGEPLAGLELAQNDVLAGRDGQAVYRQSPSGQRIPTGMGTREEPVAGVGLRLTVDRDLQWYAEQQLEKAVQDARADSGAAVVLKLEPDAHEIVAVASTPLMDPNHPEKTDAADRGSEAVEAAYEPGSVFKPLTFAAVLEEDAAEPTTTLTVPDDIERSGHTIHDYYSHAADEMTLAGILAKSSNVGTLLASELIDKDVFRDYLAAFGLGERTGIGLPAETSGRLPEDWTDLTRDNISFGQGVSVNAVQMASAYATIANSGVRIDPSLISATIGADGEETPVDPAEPIRVVSEETAAQVTSMMEAVTGPGGTGQVAALDGYRVAGKTGTAQRVDPECGCYGQYNSSFMGFAPADDPEYVVVVSLMNPREGNSGASLAGPAFTSIMRFALESGGVPPSQGEAPQLPLFAEEITDDTEEAG